MAPKPARIINERRYDPSMSSITRPELAKARSEEISPIGFTQREQDCLRSAFAVLLSPLDSIDAESWRGEVGRTLCDLLGADRASFQLDIPGIPLLYSEDHSQATLVAYGVYKK